MTKLIELQPISYRDWAKPGERHSIDFRVVNNTIFPIPFLFYSVFRNEEQVASGMVTFPGLFRHSNVVSLEVEAGEPGIESYSIKIGPMPLALIPIERWEFTLQVVK